MWYIKSFVIILEKCNISNELKLFRIRENQKISIDFLVCHVAYIGLSGTRHETSTLYQMQCPYVFCKLEYNIFNLSRDLTKTTFLKALVTLCVTGHWNISRSWQVWWLWGLWQRILDVFNLLRDITFETSLNCYVT